MDFAVIKRGFEGLRAFEEQKNNEMDIDDFFMERAFMLAWRAAGKTYPNPLVGAVLSKDGRVIAEGWHERAGMPHAEVVAIEKAGSMAGGATLYVNLEPCCHFGKTPPCTDRIIEAGVKRVVISSRDPYKEVFGSGIEKLNDSDIRVDLGIKKEKGLLLNLPYFKRILNEEREVTVILKAAVSLDGKMSASPGRRTAITSETAGEWTCKLRAQADGILVGIETLLVDDPRFDCGGLSGVEDPVPVILDTFLRFPPEHRWMEEKRDFYVFCGNSCDRSKLNAFRNSSARVIQCTDRGGRVDLEEVLSRLSDEGIRTIVVEGGARVFSSFISAGIWDAMYVLTAGKLIGENGVSLFQGKEPVNLEAVAAGNEMLGKDSLCCYLNRKTVETMSEKLF